MRLAHNSKNIVLGTLLTAGPIFAPVLVLLVTGVEQAHVKVIVTWVVLAVSYAVLRYIFSRQGNNS